VRGNIAKYVTILTTEPIGVLYHEPALMVVLALSRHLKCTVSEVGRRSSRWSGFAKLQIINVSFDDGTAIVYAKADERSFSRGQS
jgi:hypothetical protein